MIFNKPFIILFLNKTLNFTRKMIFRNTFLIVAGVISIGAIYYTLQVYKNLTDKETMENKTCLCDGNEYLNENRDLSSDSKNSDEAISTKNKVNLNELTVENASISYNPCFNEEEITEISPLSRKESDNNYSCLAKANYKPKNALKRCSSDLDTYCKLKSAEVETSFDNNFCVSSCNESTNNSTCNEKSNLCLTNDGDSSYNSHVDKFIRSRSVKHLNENMFEDFPLLLDIFVNEFYSQKFTNTRKTPYSSDLNVLMSINHNTSLSGYTKVVLICLLFTFRECSELPIGYLKEIKIPFEINNVHIKVQPWSKINTIYEERLSSDYTLQSVPFSTFTKLGLRRIENLLKSTNKNVLFVENFAKNIKEAYFSYKYSEIYRDSPIDVIDGLICANKDLIKNFVFSGIYSDKIQYILKNYAIKADKFGDRISVLDMGVGLYLLNIIRIFTN